MAAAVARLVRRWVGAVRRAPTWLVDLLVAVVVSQADLVAVLFAEQAPQIIDVRPVPAGVAALLVVAIAAPLVFRRQAPNVVMAATGFGAGAAAAAGIPVQALAPLVALYSVAAYARLVDAVISTAIFLAITTALVAADGGVALLYSNTLIVVGVAVVGRIVHAYRLQTVELATRATELERSREAQAALAVTAERSRIARDMHDVLAHSTSVVVVQATGARRTLEAGGPDAADRAAEALAVVEQTSRRSLADLRRLLGVLRDPDGEQTAPTRPQPGLADLDELVADVRAAGLPVHLRRAAAGPDPGPAIDPAVGQCAYRLVQEALTNSLRHASPTRVTVDVRVADERLFVEVLDDGGPARAATEAAHGYGLVGMRERVALVGGRLEAGPRPGGGFRVAASLPLAPAEGTPTA